MEHPTAQIKAIKQMKPFIRLTHARYRALQKEGIQAGTPVVGWD